MLSAVSVFPPDLHVIHENLDICTKFLPVVADWISLIDIVCEFQIAIDAFFLRIREII